MKDQHNDLHSFNTRTRIWRKYYLVTYPLQRDQHQVCRVPGKSAVLFGGFSSAKNVLLNDLWVIDYSKANPEKNLDSDVQGADWVKVENDAGPRPGPRRGHCMISSGTTLFLFGGATREKNQSEATVDSNLYILETGCKPWTWSILKTLGVSPSARMLHCMEFYGPTQVFLFGGLSISPAREKSVLSLEEDEEPCKALNDLYMLHLPTVSFSRPFAANFIPPPRYGAAVASDRNEDQPMLLIVGGLNTEYCYIDPFLLKEETISNDTEWKLKLHHLNKEYGETPLKESLRQAKDIIAQNDSRITELEGIYSELLRQE
eukprot:TRINITY_DN13182_c0_g3_i1.p1 TRINITY_DN13182_c0_g3~~TRINITY_DN13182_c0_g3_i1.p1  ORF type:complete len:317 (+),score=97.31 TRINITY_DN13182_c0_g3_i1:458-1408(+)